MKNKYERSLKRKEQKRIESEERNRGKDSTHREVKQKWRKLGDGGVAFGDKFKIGRTGLIVMPTMIGLVIFFSIGLNGVYDDFLYDNFGSNKVIGTNTFEPITFEECEAIDFNNDSCTLEYKFCREYADGTSLCQYGETNPFVNVDPTERQFTEEEQDFLPPTDMLAIIPQAFGASLQQEKIWAANVKQCGMYDCSSVVKPEIPEETQFDGKTIRLTQGKYDAIEPISLGIERSKSCVASSTCISNRELVTLYDNTHQVYSGVFVDDGDGDVVRGPSLYQKHWNIYPYVGMPVVIAVEPDAKWIPYMTSNIIIEPSKFTYIQPEDSIYMNRVGGNVTHYNDIYINGCDWGRVTSDPVLINRLVEYFLSECEIEEPHRQTMIIIPTLPINHEDFKWYQYTKWLNAMSEVCRQKC